MGLEPGDGGGGGRKQHHGAEYKTPEVPLTATKMGRASPGGCNVVVLKDGGHTGDIS